MSPDARRRAFSLRRRSRVIGVAAGLLAILAVAGAVITFTRLLDARELLFDRVDPAVAETERLLASFVEQDNGVRAFVLTGDESFLSPFELGLADEAGCTEELRRLLRGSARARGELEEALAAAERWRSEYALPTISGVREGDASVSTDPVLREGRTLFEAIRREVDDVQRQLAGDRARARDELEDATAGLVVSLVGASVLLVVAVGSLWYLVRRSVQRPLDRLQSDAQVVAGGDVEHRIAPTGPDELVRLGHALEQMRLRLVTALRGSDAARAELEARSTDLARSNAELEQFAYVASHDLQEPLRKVTSFCQLLQTRYADQLDARANQYIDFAVDGAKRMQALINDLLAFSRVGRVRGEQQAVDLDAVAAAALSNLASAIEDTGATVHVAPLPTVVGERALLVAVFQNLIGNAIKYHREGVPPVVSVEVADATTDRDPTGAAAGELHHLVVRDNGIGIEPEYAERVFVIFQRLHSKEQYSGTGIGLSLCRKIVEHHGGQIWAATDVDEGAAIHVTLPVAAPAGGGTGSRDDGTAAGRGPDRPADRRATMSTDGPTDRPRPTDRAASVSAGHARTSENGSDRT